MGTAEKQTCPNPDSKDEEEEGPPSMLDLAFVMDCTGSMGPYIHAAKRSIEHIVETIVATEKCDVRMAFVQYRDHPPQDRSYVTRSHDFTPSPRDMRRWLTRNAHAAGGGDEPEALADGLHRVKSLSWRPQSTKICIVITDAPPHGLYRDYNFPAGCPRGHDPVKLTNQLAEMGVVMYVVGCEPGIVPYTDFFMALVEISGGQYVPLKRAKHLAQVIIGGAKEEICIQRLLVDIEEEVVQQLNQDGECGESREKGRKTVVEEVHCKLQERGIETSQLWKNETVLEETSQAAKLLAECDSLADMKDKFKPRASVHSSSHPCRKSGRSRASRRIEWRRKRRIHFDSRSRSRSISRSRSRSRSPRRRYSRSPSVLARSWSRSWSRSRSRSRERYRRRSRSRSISRGGDVVEVSLRSLSRSCSRSRSRERCGRRSRSRSRSISIDREVVSVTVRRSRSRSYSPDTSREIVEVRYRRSRSSSRSRSRSRSFSPHVSAEVAELRWRSRSRSRSRSRLRSRSPVYRTERAAINYRQAERLVRMVGRRNRICW